MADCDAWLPIKKRRLREHVTSAASALSSSCASFSPPLSTVAAPVIDSKGKHALTKTGNEDSNKSFDGMGLKNNRQPAIVDKTCFRAIDINLEELTYVPPQSAQQHRAPNAKFGHGRSQRPTFKPPRRKTRVRFNIPSWFLVWEQCESRIAELHNCFWCSVLCRCDAILSMYPYVFSIFVNFYFASSPNL